MTKETLIDRWISRCDPKNVQQMKELLESLNFNELARVFFVIDSEKGMSINQISLKYKTTKHIVKHQIRVAKEKNRGKISPTKLN